LEGEIKTRKYLDKLKLEWEKLSETANLIELGEKLTSIQ
jgi:hypothetical protein